MKLCWLNVYLPAKPEPLNERHKINASYSMGPVQFTSTSINKKT